MPLPAAGLPWFMAVFGRDSLLTSFQSLPFVPELTAATLRALAVLQARKEDPFRDSEPGKILHEVRLGEMTAFEARPQSPYYGAADATMLWLIMLEEYERWTGDTDIVRELEREARAALAWIDNYGDRDKDGYVEYERRQDTGLDNQCWKDSWDSIAFADGTLASTPRATCELQGYVYDAKHRCARLAREVWDDPALAERLDKEAEELEAALQQGLLDPRARLLRAGAGRPEAQGRFADLEHRPPAVERDRRRGQGRQLREAPDERRAVLGLGDPDDGVERGSYNPIGYHVGTVWPHDSSFVAWGLRRYGYKAEAAKICRAILEAADLFDGRLPEAFGGYPRTKTSYPVEYPTACSPQAWATGAPLLVLRTLLGLDSDGKHMIIDPAIPEPLGRIELLNIPGAWGRMDAFGRALAAHEDCTPREASSGLPTVTQRPAFAPRSTRRERLDLPHDDQRRPLPLAHGGLARASLRRRFGTRSGSDDLFRGEETNCLVARRQLRRHHRLHRPLQVENGLIPMGRIPGHRPRGDPTELERQRRAGVGAGEHDRTGPRLGDHGVDLGTAKRRPSEQDGVKHRPQTEHVGALVDEVGVAEGLLGRHERGRAVQPAPKHARRRIVPRGDLGWAARKRPAAR